MLVHVCVDDALGVGVDKKCPWWAGCSEVTTLRHPRWSGTDERVLLLLRECGHNEMRRYGGVDGHDS